MGNWPARDVLAQSGPISGWHPTIYPVRVRLRDLLAHDGQLSYRQMADFYVNGRGVTKVLHFTFSVLPGGSGPWNWPRARPLVRVRPGWPRRSAAPPQDAAAGPGRIRAGCGFRAALGQSGNTRQLLLAVATSRPAPSWISASARATRRPGLVTRPTATRVPLSMVTGRR